MEENNKNSFVLYDDQYTLIKKLDINKKGSLLTAIFEYQINGILPELDPLTDLVFTAIKQTLDRDKEKYLRKCKANSENGAKGGRPSNNKSKKAKGFDDNPTKTKKADSDNDTDNDTDNVSDNDTDNELKKKNNKKKFLIPTLQEVSEYCEERNNTIDPQYFIDYYESKGWLVGKSPMKDWKATIRNWERTNRDSSVSSSCQTRGFYD